MSGNTFLEQLLAIKDAAVSVEVREHVCIEAPMARRNEVIDLLFEHRWSATISGPKRTSDSTVDPEIYSVQAWRRKVGD